MLVLQLIEAFLFRQIRPTSVLILCLMLGAAEAHPPAIAIVLDDLGNNLTLGKQALALPGRLTYAFLPHTPYSSGLSRLARATGRESMVHLPMQSLNHTTLGPGALTLDMDAAELKNTLLEDLASVPFAVGANNHMGSSFTGNVQAMSQVMEILSEQWDMYFLDSRTHDSTIAEHAARQASVPTTRRDIFLDNQRNEAYIVSQLNLLLVKAQTQGTAVAIGHPYPETLAVLARRLPELKALGVELISLSQLIQRQSKRKPPSSVQIPSIVSTGKVNTKKGEN